MALQKSITTAFGLEAPIAYAKISQCSGNKQSIDIEVEWFASQEARDAGTPVMLRQAYTWQTEAADSLVASMYAYLKTLEDFQGATDV